MVKVAVTGGSSRTWKPEAVPDAVLVQILSDLLHAELAREVIDRLSTSGKHQVLALSRQDPSSFPKLATVTWVQTSFEDPSELTSMLSGVDTVISFTDPVRDAGGQVQIRLIGAAVDAGVKRFAPSEWSTGNDLDKCMDVFIWYESKLKVRDHLRQLNKDKKIIEYTLFQPGIFMEYLGYPKKTAKHLTAMASTVSLSQRRVIAMQGQLEDPVTFTSAEDIARVVVAAVEYQGTWPETGGISGDRMSVKQVQAIGERITGKPFHVDVLRKEDIEAGIMNIDNVPPVGHHSIPADKMESFSRTIIPAMLISMERGAWTTTDEWNRLLPDLKFTSVEDYAGRLEKLD